jgi:hypothetical protein
MYSEFGLLIRKRFQNLTRQEARKFSTAVTGNQQKMFEIITVTVNFKTEHQNGIYQGNFAGLVDYVEGGEEECMCDNDGKTRWKKTTGKTNA